MSHVDVMLLLDEIQFSQTLRNFNNIILTFKKKPTTAIWRLFMITNMHNTVIKALVICQVQLCNIYY